MTLAFFNTVPWFYEEKYCLVPDRTNVPSLAHAPAKRGTGV